MMKRYLLFHVLALVAIAWTISPAQRLRNDSLYSPAVGKVLRLQVLLPDSLSARDHPLLILLHGYTGNERNWIGETNLDRFTRSMNLIIATPQGDSSWYVNRLGDSQGKYEDFISRELIRHLVNRYHVDTTRIAIGGLSMGGYGALVNGLRHPEVFSFAAGLSASLDVPQNIPDLEKNGRIGLKKSLLLALGGEPSPQWDRYNVFKLAAAIPPSRAPYLYLANGIQDEFAGRRDLYRAFTDTLKNHSVAFEFHESPGRHSMDYWSREILLVINRLRERWGF
jgi:S-formylglutathione hydrolase FrmB